MQRMHVIIWERMLADILRAHSFALDSFSVGMSFPTVIMARNADVLYEIYVEDCNYARFLGNLVIEFRLNEGCVSFTQTISQH